MMLLDVLIYDKDFLNFGSDSIEKRGVKIFAAKLDRVILFYLFMIPLLPFLR